MDTPNSGVGKYYKTKKRMVFLAIGSVNKPVSLNQCIHFFFKEKNVSNTRFVFHSKNPKDQLYSEIPKKI
jgi:hypothetical protein